MQFPVSYIIVFAQPERGTKRKKGDKNDSEKTNDSKKRPVTADLTTGSGISEEERMKILEMVENEPEVSDEMMDKNVLTVTVSYFLPALQIFLIMWFFKDFFVFCAASSEWHLAILGILYSFSNRAW